MKKQSIVQYDFLKKRLTLLSFGLSLGIIQVIIYGIYKKNGQFFTDSFTDPFLFLNRIVVDRILIESLSIFILVFILLKLQRIWKHETPINTYERFVYNLKCLPIILLSLLVFTPIGIFLRYLLRNGIPLNEDLLAAYMGNLKNIYLQTLPPFVVMSYILTNLNLSFQKRRREEEKSEEIFELENETIEVINENGNTFIEIDSILWIEKNARVYEVQTTDKVYFIRKRTLLELEKYLQPFGFLRINRSVLANKKHIHNYSFWEFDKFILRMNDKQKTEFIVSRERIKLLKEKL